MKKVFLSILIILMSTVFSFADESLLFSDRPGSYAIYHDLRFENEAIVGLCYLGENTIIVRSYEPKSENELLLMVEFTLSDNQIELGQNLRVLQGDMSSSPAASRLLPMLMNWASSWYVSKEKIADNETYSISTDDDYKYCFWIPVFQIETIGNKKDFTVISIGSLTDLSDPRFFAFNELPEPEDAESFKIKQGEEIEVEIDGIYAPLDDNWKSDDNRIYRIDNKTPQDAVFMIETINYTEAGFPSLKELAKILLIGNTNIIILADGSKIFFEDGVYNIIFRMYDPNQNQVTIQQTQLIDRDDGYVSIATLACYETLYLQNKEYFDKIFY